MPFVNTRSSAAKRGKRRVAPNTVNGTVPPRRLLNAKRRPREYLTVKEVGKLVVGWQAGHVRHIALQMPRPPSSVQEPDNERQHNADDDARGDRCIKDKIATFDPDIARQVPEAKPRKPWPQQADCGDHKSDDDQGARH